MTQSEKTEILNSFISSNKSILLSHAKRYFGDDGEDVLQDAIVKAWENLDKFRKPYLIKPWFWQILKTTIINRHTRETAQRRGNGQKDIAIDNVDIVAYETETGLSDNLLIALQKIKSKYSTVLFLCEVRGFTYSEAAAKLGIPAGTVGSRLYRAKSMLRRHYRHELL